MDQVLSVVCETLSVFYVNKNEKILTASMVNNYVKQKVLPPPKAKRYNTSQLAYLLALTVLKQVLSIGEISQLIQYQSDHFPLKETYNRFCDEMEAAIQTVFRKEAYAGVEEDGVFASSQGAELLRAAVLSFINKIYVQKCLQFETQELKKEE